MNTKTYRGRSLEELLPKVRAELGPDAVIVRQREGLTGGVGGFFQKRLVEIEAAAPERDAPGGTVDVRDDSPAAPDFLAQLSEAQAAVENADFVPLELPEVLDDDAWSGWRDPAPAPAVGPFVTEQVAELPQPELLPAAPPPAPPPAQWPAEASTLRDALVARGIEAPLADEVVEETITPLVPLQSPA